MTTTVDKKQLASKLVRIMDEIGPIKKSGWNSFHKYNYLKEEDIINAVRPLLTKYGVAIVPNVLNEEVSHSTTQRGTQETLSRLQVEFTFIDMETSEQIPVVTMGHGTDAGDKAAYKAMTGALKYALRQTFMISEGGDDPEADESADARRAQAVADEPGVVIGSSSVAGVSRGGRNANANRIQIDRLRDLARERNLSLGGMAALISVVNGDEVDVSDPALAGMNVQAYLVSNPVAKVTALIRALEAEESVDDLPPLASEPLPFDSDPPQIIP